MIGIEEEEDSKIWSLGGWEDNSAAEEMKEVKQKLFCPGNSKRGRNEGL